MKVYDNVLENYEAEDVADFDNDRLRDAQDTIEDNMDAMAEDFKPVATKTDFKNVDQKELDRCKDNIEEAESGDSFELLDDDLTDAVNNMPDDAYYEDVKAYNKDWRILDRWVNKTYAHFADWHDLMDDAY